MPVTAQDRCDACGAQAMWSVWVELTELMYCNSHFRAYEVKLRAASETIIDHTWQFDWMSR